MGRSARKQKQKKTSIQFVQSQEDKSVLIEENKKAIAALRKVIYFLNGNHRNLGITQAKKIVEADLEEGKKKGCCKF